MEIRDRTVVITGGGGGIGAALARRMVAAGARVCLADVDPERLDAVAQELRCLGTVCDVTQEVEVARLIAGAEQALGPVDIFVSNAGVAKGQPAHVASASDRTWTLNWELHVMAQVYAVRALLPGMIERGSGHFVTVASAAGLLNQIGDAAYSATKHAAVSFAESLAISHGDDGIGVTVVCPQYVATPLIGLTEADARDNPSLLRAGDVAEVIVQGIEDDAFLILPHARVAEYARSRAQDHDRWIAGMRKLQRRARRPDGTVRIGDFYKLV